MSRRTIELPVGLRDGTSQRGRAVAALDPGYAVIDERGSQELLAFVQKFAERLRYYKADANGAQLIEDGTWQAFAQRADLSVADIVAYVLNQKQKLENDATPDRFQGEQARWLGRPHFALLLSFIELLGYARVQLNGLTERHLDFYYRELLQFLAEPAEADHAALVFELANRVAGLRLPAGTALLAGRDSSGVARTYRTERELQLNRARVAELRSVYVDRRSIGIPQVHDILDLTAAEAFDAALRLALGSPTPGAPVPPFRDQAVDWAFFAGLGALLEFSSRALQLEQHELRALLKRVRRRQGADAEWAEINRRLNPPDFRVPRSFANPRDFSSNLFAVVGKLDFAGDALPQVNDVDDLFTYRSDPAVRAYIDAHLGAIGLSNFEAAMRIKLRADAEWGEINRLLELVGRRKRGVRLWRLAPTPATVTAFDDNLAKALGVSAAGGVLPLDWPWGTRDVYTYESLLRELEAQLSMPVEQMARLAAFATAIEGAPDAEGFSGGEVDRILASAHRERSHAARRAELAAARANQDERADFERVLGFVLSGRPDPLPWSVASPRLEPYLDKGQRDLLQSFLNQLAEPGATRFIDWPDVYKVLELAQRFLQRLPEPVARSVEWHNLYAQADARSQLVGEGSTPRWKAFGQVPPAEPAHPPSATLGWALRSPLLALSEGTRTLKLGLVFEADSFERASFLGGLGLTEGELDEAKLRTALARALRVEVSTTKGWVELTIAPGVELGVVQLPKGGAQPEVAPALRWAFVADATCDAFAPLGGSADAWPSLRVLLRQHWDEEQAEWTTQLAPFEPLLLRQVQLRIEVQGLAGLVLQQEERTLDAHKPFEPFGSRPASGARLLLNHPELARPRLDALHFVIEWMGLPKSLAEHYRNYPNRQGAGSFLARLGLVDRNLDLQLSSGPLFADNADQTTQTSFSFGLDDVPSGLHDKPGQSGFSYESRLEPGVGSDLSSSGRYFYLELGAQDFGHASYPSLAAKMARAFALALVQGIDGVTQGQRVEDFQVEPAYTPVIQRLTARYMSSLELDPRAAAGADVLLHVHPFGVAPIDPSEPRLLPRYDQAGELYIGLRGLAAPEHLTLLFQLAEGTSDPDQEAAVVSWSYLDADRWQDLGDGGVLRDSTRGLINSGILEFALPAVSPSTRLPGDLYWLRAALPRNTSSVCDIVDIRAQAVEARFDDQGNAPDHYAQPLPAGTIQRLLEPDARIVRIEQPFTSHGGRPPEQAAAFRTRVSERLRHKQRALSPWDYEHLVLQRFKEIHKAKCLPATLLEPGRVELVVIPDVRRAQPSDPFAPKAPANLLADIQAWLSARASGALLVRVRNAQYVPVRVRLGVRFVAGMDEGLAKQRLNQDIIRFLSPWAYDDGVDVMLGGSIYANSILDFVDRRDYVEYVAELKLFLGTDTGRADQVSAAGPDQVLVAARDHQIDLISELGYSQASFTGINYMKIELDFIVG